MKREELLKRFNTTAFDLRLHMAMGTLSPSISINDKTFLYKTLDFEKPSTRTLKATQSQFSPSTRNHSSALHFSHGKTNSNNENTVQFDDLHRNWNLKRTLFEKLKDKESDPVRILEEDGDWSKELFWAVVGFLNQTSRSNQVLQVFDEWKSKDNSRITRFNYERIISLLVDEGLVEFAAVALENLKIKIQPSSEMYDSIIHGFSQKARFADAILYLNEMEDSKMNPHTTTYNALIEAYAKNGLYDDMAKCVKKMESNGCFPDQSTYNLLIKEFSRAGLIKRMERTYQIVISKRMDLEASTMVAMLETYANFGILEKMDKVYRRVSKVNPLPHLKDDLIRKVASVYIENYMFSKLEEMGLDLSLKTGRTHFMWCLRMLSRACGSSRAGMASLVREMESKKAPWSLTVANTMLFAYAKMNDFEKFKVVLMEMAARDLKPDVVTCRIVFDARGFGFGLDGLGYWKKIGFLEGIVEVKTDPLVLVAFGKEDFMRIVENEVDHRRKDLTYENLFKLIKKHQHEN